MPLFQRDRPHTVIAAEAGVSHPEAFTRLYRDFFDPVYWYCRNRLGSTTEAEDAASTIFARALAAGPRYDDPALRSWLFTIAHNVVVNAYRASRPLATLEAVWDLPDPVSPLEDAVIAEEERRRLLAALQQLPDDQRQVVELRMAGLTGPEIAGVMGRSHGAIKMLQLRAYTRLRALLADAADDGSDHHG